MGLIAKVALFIVGLVATALAQQLTDEFKAWMPWVIERLVRHAVTKLPADQQGRFGEEWRSHLDETPGEIGRFIVALGFTIAALKMSAMLRWGRDGGFIGNGVKRAIDLLFSTVCLIDVAPLLGAMALAARVCSGRLVVAQESRVGFRGRAFGRMRFRVFARREVSAPGRDDQQVFGRQLWRINKLFEVTSLEELPAFLNVIRGDMSLVGPRAHSLELAERMSKVFPRYHEREKIRPGFVGWAQVRGSSHPAEELEDDIYYVEHRSAWLDLVILFRAFAMLFHGRSPRDRSSH